MELRFAENRVACENDAILSQGVRGEMRTLLHGLRQRIVLLAQAGAVWVGLFNLAWAQEEAAESKASGGAAYVAPYALVILAVGLAIFVVCNPSRRRERARPEDYQQKL
jgi:hypothetical protein